MANRELTLLVVLSLCSLSPFLVGQGCVIKTNSATVIEDNSVSGLLFPAAPPSLHSGSATRLCHTSANAAWYDWSLRSSPGEATVVTISSPHTQCTDIIFAANAPAGEYVFDGVATYPGNNTMGGSSIVTVVP